MRSSERGNAVIFILLGIALFAALAYTFMRGAQQGQGNLTAGQTRLLAQEMINEANNIQRAVNRLLSRGCSENDLNFYTVENPLPLNPDAPVDGRCDIFGSTGGGLTINMFEGHVLNIQPSSQVHVTGTATTAGDLSYYYRGVSDQLCIELNRQLGLDDAGTIPEDASNVVGGAFVGTYYAAGFAEDPINDEDPRTLNRTAGCVKMTSISNINVFGALLIDR